MATSAPAQPAGATPLDSIKASEVVLNVFLEPRWPWDTWLKDKLPPFDELYCEPEAAAGEMPTLVNLRSAWPRCPMPSCS